MSLPIGPHALLGRLQTQFDAMYLLSVRSDSVHTLKPHDGFPVDMRCGWRDQLPALLRRVVSPADQEAVCALVTPDHLRSTLRSMDDQNELYFLSMDGHWKRLVLLPLSFDGDGVDQVLYLVSDQTFHLSRLQALQAVSEHDSLTYLFNRQKLAQMIQTEYRTLRSCGVLFFDINNLKQVNDAQGHAAGDALICQVAESIRSISNRNALCYRYGGDEFIVVAADCTPAQLQNLIVLWKNRMANLSLQSGLHAEVAVGKAWRQAPCDVPALIHLADLDMYENKRRMKRR